MMNAIIRWFDKTRRDNEAKASPGMGSAEYEARRDAILLFIAQVYTWDERNWTLKTDERQLPEMLAEMVVANAQGSLVHQWKHEYGWGTYHSPFNEEVRRIRELLRNINKVAGTLYRGGER